MFLRKLLTMGVVGIAVSAYSLTLPAIIGDNMMLQQQTDAKLWGWAKPGSSVKVVTDWNGKAYTTKTDANGKWVLKVTTPEASYEPTSFSVTGDGTTIKVDNVLIGEVWFASGQSNMEMPLAGFPGSVVEGANDAIATANRYNKAIRFSTTPRALYKTPQDSVGGTWKECNPENAPEFSAVGYFFATKLNDILDVPVGIINCSYGGTCVEGWMPESILRDYPNVDLTLAAKEGVMECYQPMSMYNGMLYPLSGYTVKGFIWNQGESNALTGTQHLYAEYLNKMILHWRELWGDENLPFYTVEIPPFNYDGPNNVMSATEREAQQKAVEMTPNTGIISSIDLYTPGLTGQIHPSVKRPAGNRLAYMAAGATYGVKGIRYESPKYREMVIENDGATVLLKFDNAHDGFSPFQGLKGFEVAGEDKVFHPADATQVFGPHPEVSGIRVSSPDVQKIAAVRYAFKNWPEEANVYGLSEMPLLPFRTDNW